MMDSGKTGDLDSSPETGTRLDSRSVRIEPLSPARTVEMVNIIRRNLDSFEDAGSILAASFRRLENFYETYSRPGSIYLVVTDPASGRCIGGAGLGPLAGLPTTEEIGEIRELVIEKPWRNQGIGSCLLNACLVQAREFRYRRIYLETTPEMDKATKLFKRYGFQPVTEGRDPAGMALPSYYVLDTSTRGNGPSGSE